MNNHVRQKIYEWLLEITTNLTTFDQQGNKKPQITFSVNDHIELTTTMDMELQNDVKSFFNGLNLTQFNISNENMKAFIAQLNISSKPHPVAKYEVDICDGYCNGSFRDALFGYRAFHGYISLVVGFTILFILFRSINQLFFVFRCVYLEQ